MSEILHDLAARLRSVRGVLVDSNILLDLALSDPRWEPWSSEALADVASRTSLIINPLIYAEVSAGFPTVEALDEALPPSIYAREPLPWEAGFLAARAFVRHRRAGGLRSSPLPDFYIGAHAATGGLAVLTRDPARFRTYFPTVEILAPERV